MSVWYMPSWNGDFRLIEVQNSTYRDSAGDDACVLEIVDPTEHETGLLTDFLADAVKKKWTAVQKIVTKEVNGQQRQEVLLATSMDDAGKALVKVVKPVDRTITAVRYENGKLVVHDTAALVAPTPAVTPEVVPKAGEGEKKKEETKAASLTRPTPSCPQCVPGATDRASEVLLAFLTPDEHDLWARERHLVVTGGLSGNRYVIAHRHSKLAAKIGRICFDLDDDCVVHFHDNSVPPEEEVLAAKLILEHREPWLRNEATMLGLPWNKLRFKNPFGDGMDGVPDARTTQAIGDALRMFGL